MISRILQKLRDPEYRKAYVASQINIGVPFQLRAMLKAREWTQEMLAERTGMLQPRISAILKPGKTRPNIETLRRLAEAFDCAIIVRFAPFSELIGWSDKFNPDKFAVRSFDEETNAEEQVGEADRQQQVATVKVPIPTISAIPDITGRGAPEDFAYFSKQWKQHAFEAKPFSGTKALTLSQLAGYGSVATTVKNSQSQRLASEPVPDQRVVGNILRMPTPRRGLLYWHDARRKKPA